MALKCASKKAVCISASVKILVFVPCTGSSCLYRKRGAQQDLLTCRFPGAEETYIFRVGHASRHKCCRSPVHLSKPKACISIPFLVCGCNSEFYNSVINVSWDFLW